MAMGSRATTTTTTIIATRPLGSKMIAAGGAVMRTIIWTVAFLVTLQTTVVRVDAIYPEYELEPRVGLVLKAIENAVVDAFSPNVLRDVNSLVTFRCRKSANASYVRVVTNDPQVGDKINIDLPVVLFIHGWFDSYDRTWINGTANIYQRHMLENVCTVDWSRLALTSYKQSAMNTRLVGQQLVYFLQFLQSKGVHLNNVTLIGHSFGSQVAGYAGALLNGKVGRIFGLDPAGWSFTKPFLVDAFYRLDRTDAKFVQCIHTARNYLGLGSGVECGHQDFYPNDGLSPQPGCVNPRQEGGPSLFQWTCSHFKAVEFFAVTLNPKSKLKGWRCSKGYHWWKLGLCGSSKFDYMGVHSRQAVNGKLYLQVGLVSPFSVKD